MPHEFDKRRNAPHSDCTEMDQEALRFIKSWHRAPELHDILWYKGVNLGEVDEYDTFPEVVKALIDREAREQQ